MPEYKTPVTPVKVNYTCDKCGLGTMQYGTVEPTQNPQWPQSVTFMHKCSNVDCNQLQDLPRIYPHIRYEHG